MCDLEIHIDTRERKLIQACKEQVIPYKTSNLSLGDIQIRHAGSQAIAMMIERKTWKDLAASIIDHRYKEQHARYTEWAQEHSCPVWYILEGTKKFRTPAQEKRTLSAHVSLCFDPMVRIVETRTPSETMAWIHRVVAKIHTKGDDWCKSGFYSETRETTTQETDTLDLELAHQKSNKVGKKEHSLKSTWIAMLSCIYGMSVHKANSILSHWNSLDDWKQCLTNHSEKECIQILRQVPMLNQKRKLGPILAKRIYDVFCFNIVKTE